jgi:hypothetical protein
MSDPSLGDTGDTIINDDAPSNSSGLDPGIETAIIVNVVVWVFIGGLFLCLYCTFFRPLRRISKANNSRTKTPKPSPKHWLWRNRNHEAVRGEAVRVELGRADREFAAHGEREEERIRVTRTGGGRKRPSLASKLLPIFFSSKKTEEQNGERINLGPIQTGGMSTSTPTSSSGARNEEIHLIAIPNLKKLFMAKEEKGKERKGETRKGSYFGPLFRWLKTDVMSAERRNGGDEESLMCMEEEKRDGLGVEVKEPAKRSTWGSEAPPAYESLAEDQHQERN